MEESMVQDPEGDQEILGGRNSRWPVKTEVGGRLREMEIRREEKERRR